MSDVGNPGPIDVTDLYDAFHAIAAAIWRDFGTSVDDESWDDIIDSLEHDLFLAACARRCSEGVSEDEMPEPDEIPARIRLVQNGTEVVGAGGQYHSHAFYPDPATSLVPNAIMTANLMSRSRSDVTLVLTSHTRKRQTRRHQLPQV